MTSAEVKQQLKKTTEDAVEAGVSSSKVTLTLFSSRSMLYYICQAFGAPTIVATDSSNHKQMVFGSDRFPILADIIEEKYEGPLPELNKAKLWLTQGTCHLVNVRGFMSFIGVELLASRRFIKQSSWLELINF